MRNGFRCVQAMPKPRLIDKLHVVHPEGVAYCSPESRLDAGREHDYDVRRFVGGAAPPDLLYFHHLPFAVPATVRIPVFGHQPHVGLEPRLRCYVAVADGQLVGVLPGGNRLAETLVARSYALGVNVAVGILPAFLQENEHHGGILARVFLQFETVRFGYDALVGDAGLVVEHEGARLAREGDAHVYVAIGVVRAAYGFQRAAQEDGAGHDHRYVDDAEHLHPFQHHVHTRAIAVAAPFGEHRVAAFGYAGHVGIGVRAAPRGVEAVLVRVVAVERVRGSNDIKRFLLAAKQFGLGDVPHGKVLEVAIADGFGTLRPQGGGQGCHDGGQEYLVLSHKVIGLYGANIRKSIGLRAMPRIGRAHQPCRRI